VTVVLPYQIAVGGVKIQVKEEDAEAALRLLAEYRGDGVNAEDLERQAVAAQAEEVEPQPAGEAPPEDILSEGELLAHRALWGAVLGMLFLPFQFVVLWMVYRALVSEAPLRPRYFRRAWCAFFIAAGSLILIWLSFMGLLWY
jgi:hypothetical protein